MSSDVNRLPARITLPYELAPITRFKRIVRLGIKSLWLHRLRSLLTVLGIVFGVCSVIAMLAIGEGARYEALEQIRRLGSNNIILRSVKPPDDKSSTAQRTYSLDYGLTYADIKRVRETIPSVQIVVPTRIIRMDIWNGPRRVDCDIMATVPWYEEVNNHHVQEGRFFNDIEMDTKANVCTIGGAMVDALFPLEEPLGKTVRVGGEYYRIIGIMEPKSARVAGGEKSEGETSGATQQATGAPHQMLIPLTAGTERFGETIIRISSGSQEAERVELHEATVKVANLDDVMETSLIISDILKSNHKKRDYELVVPLEMLRQAERTKRIFNIVLGAIAAISLLVGGIGIMNIMLASVTERTREIGIRRALGAKRRDIVQQFLVETVLLSGTGGLIGVALGLAIPFFITYFAQMKTVVTLWSPIIAFSISGLVGIIFGLYPALRAANMDPVEALRHE